MCSTTGDLRVAGSTTTIQMFLIHIQYKTCKDDVLATICADKVSYSIKFLIQTQYKTCSYDKSVVSNLRTLATVNNNRSNTINIMNNFCFSVALVNKPSDLCRLNRVIKVGAYTFTLCCDFNVYYLRCTYNTNADFAKATRIAKANVPIKAIRRHLVASRMLHRMSLVDVDNVVDSLRDWKHGVL